MSATMSDSAEESPVYEPTPNSQADARSTHRSRSHRTRQPPNALSYYSLGQPVSSQARISNVNPAVQPIPQFTYRRRMCRHRDSIPDLYQRISDSSYRPDNLNHMAKGWCLLCYVTNFVNYFHCLLRNVCC